MSRKPEDPPVPRLSESMPSLFAQAEAESRADLDEASAWRRLQSQLAAKPRASHAQRYGVALVAASVCLLLGWLGWHRYQGSLISTRNTALHAVPPPAVVSNALIRLASGQSTLPDGTSVDLTHGAEGTYEATPTRSVLNFEQGQLRIAVAHQLAGHSFAVKTHGFEFIVLGTKFTVNVAGSRVTLNVTEGRVAVHDRDHLLQVIERGGLWSNEADATQAPTPAVSTVHAAPVTSGTKFEEGEGALKAVPPSDPSTCRDLLRGGAPAQAEQCYLTIASGSGLSAEMSLYEIARLRRDVLANPSSALAALDDYETRFASGTLAPEVRAARVDLLARLGRVDEALTVSSQLLTSSSSRGRAVELRLLRGNLLRDAKHDCDAAIAEYSHIEGDPGPRGDQAEFAHARCLQQLGRNDAAVRAYQSYLARPRPQRAEEARKQLTELQP